MLRVRTATTALLALFAVGVLAADETLTTAVYGVVVPFQTSCDLKVVGSGFDVYNGDVNFLKGDKEVLHVGLQPQWEGGSLNVMNDVFKRGEKSWFDYQWLKINYPGGDGNNKRVYSFEFWDAELVIICQGKVLISIPYNELTTDKAGFLSGIDGIKLRPGDAELKFAKLCSGSAKRPALPKLILYDNANQEGTSVAVNGATPDFGDLNFDDKTESVTAVTADWEIYTGKAYTGSMFFVNEGGTLDTKHDNSYSSARPANCRYISDQTTAKLRVSTSTHLQGGLKMYLTPQAGLGEEMRNKIRSAIADKGDWELYEYTGYQGKRLVIKEGETIENTGDNKASSLRPICATYTGQEKCALQRVEVLDKEGDLEPKYTGTEIIGSQSSGSCYGPAEHEIEIT